MDYILKGHSRTDDIVTTIMMFYPNEKYAILDNICDNGECVESVLTENSAVANFYRNGKLIANNSILTDIGDEKKVRFDLRVAVFNCLMQVKPIKAPWGVLTGVRPAKIVWNLWENGIVDDNRIFEKLKFDYLVSDEKIRLAMTVAKSEKEIVTNGIGKLGLYIGIPFCPTRCLYCSFTSYPLAQYKNKVDLYLDALEKEIRYIADCGILNGKQLESIYIGGGTPTSLDEKQLERLLKAVADYLPTPIEYTVEAGRPDTVTFEKMLLLKQYNVNRISVNPQTLNDETLVAIGRRHTVSDFYSAFDTARKAGHNHINTDIILGLPGEKPEHVRKTMEGLKALSPESITVHTLAVKRASRLKETLEQYEMTDFDQMAEMLKISADYTRDMGMHPYYMYRQKNMVGNFENVGYCKNGCACIYNVQIMEERQTIIALGAGGSTKIVSADGEKIERIFNVKSVDDYINRIDEMIQRKIDGLEIKDE